jgi:hypothetical protein
MSQSNVQVSIDTPNPNDSEKPVRAKHDKLTPHQMIAVMKRSEQLMKNKLGARRNGTRRMKMRTGCSPRAPRSGINWLAAIKNAMR